jgi:hypothetical protein
MKRDHVTKRKGVSAIQAERDAELANRARITASLREQRLKRDAEIAATTTPVQPKQRTKKQEAS